MQEDQLAAILSADYGITGDIKHLVGYESANYRLTAEEGSFVVKVFRNDPQALAFIDVLVEMESWEHAELIPQVIATSAGEKIIERDDRLIVVLTWLSGSFYKDFDISPAFARNLGRFLGRLDKALSRVSKINRALMNQSWDMANYPKAKELTVNISNPQHRLLVDYFFVQVDAISADHLSGLRRGLIHNDANDWNVLTDGTNVLGLIDFGDTAYTWQVAEVAVAGAYIAMRSSAPLKHVQELVHGYHAEFPLQDNEVEVLYYLIALRCCISVCYSSSVKSLGQDEYVAISQKPAFELLSKWLRINPRRAHNAFRDACAMKPIAPLDPKSLKVDRNQTISTALSLSYAEPIAMSGGGLQFMYSYDGQSYLDLVNNICHVGHCSPKVITALSRQASTLNTNTRYLYPSLNELSERLLGMLPANIERIFFVNSGSAASDLALRMAREFTGRQTIAALEYGYHGNTSVVVDVSSYKYKGKGGKGKPDNTIEIPLPTGEGDEFIVPAHNPPAAIIAETIVGCGGQIVLPDGWLKGLFDQIHVLGGLCISDEVQTGFGRVGDKAWAFQQQGLDPDIVILGKPMGNGHPIAAVACSAEVAEKFENGMEFFSSFGGNPVSCEVGLAVMDTMHEYQLQENAQEMGSYLKEGLEDLARKHPVIADVRGSGLFLGIELKDPDSGRPATELARILLEEMKFRQVLMSTDGPDNNVIKIKPPLCINSEDVEAVISRLSVCIPMVQRRLG